MEIGYPKILTRDTIWNAVANDMKQMNDTEKESINIAPTVKDTDEECVRMMQWNYKTIDSGMII